MTRSQIVSQSKCFGGTQFICRHLSDETGTGMRFSVFLPPDSRPSHRFPVLWFLSGLSCTEENFTVKAGVQRIASALGLMVVVPDTSPRGEDVPDDPEKAYDFGLGAGFYVDAVREPWAKNYRMRSYIERELPELIAVDFPADPGRRGSWVTPWAGTARSPSPCAIRAASNRCPRSRRFPRRCAARGGKRR